jgi:hypothetical protein
LSVTHITRNQGLGPSLLTNLQELAVLTRRSPLIRLPPQSVTRRSKIERMRPQPPSSNMRIGQGLLGGRDHGKRAI